MANLIVPNENKLGVEHLLLGDLTVTVTDCNGSPVSMHGLLANDLSVKLIDNSTISFVDYIARADEGDITVSHATITLSDGSGTVTVQEIADGLQGVEYTVQDLQAKYNEEHEG